MYTTSYFYSVTNTHQAFTTVDGTIVNIDLDKQIEKFTVNIYLVLTAFRLAYRCDVHNNVNASALAVAIEETGNLLYVIPGQEPLVFFRSNSAIIAEVLKTQPNMSCFLADVLGYLYK